MCDELEMTMINNLIRISHPASLVSYLVFYSMVPIFLVGHNLHVDSGNQCSTFAQPRTKIYHQYIMSLDEWTILTVYILCTRREFVIYEYNIAVQSTIVFCEIDELNW